MKQINGDGNEAAKELVAYLKKSNIQADIPAYPSIALGACEVSLFEMVQAYTMFPGGGYNAQPFFINRIEDKNGNVLESFSPQRRKVISELTAYSVVSMMEGVISKGTGRSMYSYDIGTQAVAGKTGTTNDNSDLWFMGYTPQILAGAWVGADDRYIRFTDNYFGQGAHGSLPIWAYFMNKVANDPASNLDRNASFVRPDNLSTDFNVNFVGKDSSIDLTVPDTDAEGIAAESDYSLISNNEPSVETPAANNAPVNKSTMPKKPTTEPKQATTPANKPKAVMPKKQQ
jgi:penicillin-binding protein 1A